MTNPMSRLPVLSMHLQHGPIRDPLHDELRDLNEHQTGFVGDRHVEDRQFPSTCVAEL